MEDLKNKGICLNVGCGNDIKEGYTNLDCIPLQGVNVIHNLESFPWPFLDNTFSEVYAHQTLEHLSDKIKVMDEIWRISKKGARVYIHVPYFSSPGAFCHAEHKSYFGYNTFDYWCNPSAEITPNSHFKYVSRKIQYACSHNIIMKILNAILTPLINIYPIAYQRFLCHIIPAENLIVELKVMK